MFMYGGHVDDITNNDGNGTRGITIPYLFFEKEDSRAAKYTN